MKLEVEVNDCSDCPCAKGQHLAQYIICDHPHTLGSANISPFIAVKGIPAWCPILESEGESKGESCGADNTRAMDVNALGWYYPHDM